MKIAIDCRMIGSGGIGSYISALLPYFIKNNECFLFGKKNQIELYKNFSGVKTYIYEENCFSLREMFKFPEELKKEINSCDIYYSPYCNIPGGIKIPVFTTIHDVVFLDVKGLASKTGTIIRKFFYKRAVKHSKAIFTVSNFSKERIIHHLKCRKPIICTYNALPDWFAGGSAVTSESKKDVILFVGNIKKHKGLSILLDAFIMAKNKGLKEKLVIVGNKDNFRTKDEEIFEKIEKAPQNSVEFTGKISDEELKNLYKSSKVLVQPSLYEGFGMPPLEAMNLGTHVILSDIEVFKEIYEKFPVTYFENKNSDSLCEKLLKINEITSKKLELPKIYSFERTYEIIINTLENK